jgi:lysozyme
MKPQLGIAVLFLVSTPFLRQREDPSSAAGMGMGVSFSTRPVSNAPRFTRTEELIKTFEQLHLEAHADPGGGSTIGWGHHVRSSDADIAGRLDSARAERIFRDDLRRAEQIVRSRSRAARHLSGDRLGALVSFVFNSGGNTPTLWRLLDAGAPETEILTALMQWTHVDGKVLRGLVRRRAAEVALWTSNHELLDALLRSDPRVCEPLYAHYASGVESAVRWLVEQAPGARSSAQE